MKQEQHCSRCSRRWRQTVRHRNKRIPCQFAGQRHGDTLLLALQKNTPRPGTETRPVRAGAAENKILDGTICLGLVGGPVRQGANLVDVGP